MKIYSKLIILLAIAGMTFSVHAQPRANDQRTNETKIADIAMLLPAKDLDTHNELMSELIRIDPVIPSLAAKLLPPGQGDDFQARDAISGLAFYASQGNRPGEKEKIAKELCQSIGQTSFEEIKDFLLIQLQYVAGDESVETAAQYLDNARLADAAARVLVRIGSDAAGKALLDARTKIRESNGGGRIGLANMVIAALGDMRYQPAVEYISNVAKLKILTKTALHSLAQIADPRSQKLLAEAAAQSGYVFESTDATGSYLLFLKNSLDQGNQALVVSAGQELLKQMKSADSLVAKSVALHLYASASGEKAIPEIISALDSKNEKYRGAALLAASNLSSPKITDALLKKAKNAGSDVKAEIITFFGTTNNKAALPLVFDALKDKNPEVTAAAIAAAGKLGQEQAIAPIVNAMKSETEPAVIDAGKSALLTINSAKIADEASNGITGASTPATVALIDVLAQKRATASKEQIFQLAASNDSPVAAAAKNALASVVTEQDIPRIARILDNSSNKDDVAALQQAFYAALAGQSQDNQTDAVMEQAANSSNMNAYGNILAMIGGKRALDLVMGYGFNSGNPDLKAIAFDALTNWSDDLATPQLYRIAADNPSGPYFDKALTAYIAKIRASKSTPEQKLLLLRNALDIAKTAEQKKTILQQIGRTSTFMGMITAGKYLDDSNNDVQQAAVQAVYTTAMAHPEFYGAEVTALLNKVMAVNKESGADYQKQAILKHLSELPADNGFVSMFNGYDLTGWKGLVENPIARSKMTPKELADKQAKADDVMRQDWKVENGMLVYEGTGYDNLCSAKMYGDIEMYVDWKIGDKGDAGIYLRGSPQVQIWDISRTNVGAQVGSGGLYNNQKYKSIPLLVADNPVNEWNSFYIRMEGDKVTVYLNGQLVTDQIILENFWDRTLPIFPQDAIELQAHDSRVEYRDLYVREIPQPKPYEVSDDEKKDGFVPLFNGMNLTGWVGNVHDYYAKDGTIICDPSRGGDGNLYTENEYSDFVVRFEFQLTPAANNGLGIRAPLEGDAAYVGMELQILDSEADVYKDLHPYQYHGSVYGVIPAKRGYLKPVGQWNYEEVVAKGNRITITLNGTVILDGDIAEASNNFTATIDGRKHPGLSNKTGHIGFLGHGSWVAFKNLRIKELK